MSRQREERPLRHLIDRTILAFEIGGRRSSSSDPVPKKWVVGFTQTFYILINFLIYSVGKSLRLQLYFRSSE